MYIKIDRFSGIAPRYAPHLLPVNMAADAHNCYFEAGALRALRALDIASLPLVGGGEIRTIYRHDTRDGSYWLSSTDALDIVPSPILNDVHRRLYYAGPAQSKPRLVPESMLLSGGVNPSSSYPLGVPSPNTDEVIIGMPSGGDSSNKESRYYVITWVSRFGEESAPCNLVGERDSTGQVIGPLVCNQGCTISITRPLVPQAQDIETEITAWNIYRTNTGSKQTALQYVGQRSALNTTFVDDIPSNKLLDVLATKTWVQPPTDLLGLTLMPCGAMAGFTERRLCFSEPKYPHAWPVEYQRPMENDVVGLGVYGRSLLALTNYKPYEFVGDHPATLERQRIDDGLACINKRSIVDVGNGIMYATPEGIMLVGSGGCSLVTEQVYSRREWKSLVPDSIHAYNYGGRYVAFYDTGSERAGFMLDAAGNMVPLDFYATAGFYEPKSGELYLVVDSQGQKFDSGTELDALWRSKPMTTNRLVNFSVARVRADEYPLIFSLYAKDAPSAPYYTKSVQDDKPFRLTAGHLSDSFTVELTTQHGVNGVYLAESLKELAEME